MFLVFLSSSIVVYLHVFLVIMYVQASIKKNVLQEELKPDNFLYFYQQHEGLLNAFLFVGVMFLLLYVFLTVFFKNMQDLCDTLAGKVIKKKWRHKRFPEFLLAQAEVKKMVEKRDDSYQHVKDDKAYKNELLMYLAHDLKTPLTSLNGYINHILDHKVQQGKQQVAIGIAYDKAQRLDALIDQFSEILRYDDKVAQLDITKINIHDMLKQQLEGFTLLLENKGITLNFDIPSHMQISADYDKLLRVFDNLMRNAINYCIQDTKISISGKMLDDTIILQYTNCAQHLDPEKIEHLFEKFYRGSFARNSSSGGAGLGLAIAKEIIQLHHGQIDVVTQGQDITFTITLPYVQGVYS